MPQSQESSLSRNPFVRFQHGFESGFEKFRHGYVRLLDAVRRPCLVSSSLSSFVFAVGSVALLVPCLGQDFFPSVDSGQFKIHVRARTGTRIEETAALCDHIDATIREHIPAKEMVTIVDNIGLPYSGLNLSYSTSAPIGPADADIQVQLTAKTPSRPTTMSRSCAEVLAREYPGVTFYVLPVDIVTQILNFGLSAPIDVQIVGPNLYGNRALAEKMLNEVRYVPGAADARIQQPFDYPNMTVNVDRTRAQDCRPRPARCRPKRAGGSQRKLPDHPQLLSGPQKRRQLQRRRPDSAVQAGLLGGAAIALPVTAAVSGTNTSTLAYHSLHARRRLPARLAQHSIPSRCSAISLRSARRGTGHRKPL